MRITGRQHVRNLWLKVKSLTFLQQTKYKSLILHSTFTSGPPRLNLI